VAVRLVDVQGSGTGKRMTTFTALELDGTGRLVQTLLAYSNSDVGKFLAGEIYKR
jgi:hypothetical protein